MQNENERVFHLFCNERSSRYSRWANVIKIYFMKHNKHCTRYLLKGDFINNAS